ncbi:MAG: alpha-amylase family glycosyl hydrolase, partial [Myxococcota bacterium]|nr:alpha-amylase family glycosyl hydrolase [Myxococcota bacterium]
RLLAVRMREHLGHTSISGGEVIGAALLQDALRKILSHHIEHENPGGLTRALDALQTRLAATVSEQVYAAFVTLYATRIDNPETTLAAQEVILLDVASVNPALDNLRPMFDDGEFTSSAHFRKYIGALRQYDAEEQKPAGQESNLSLFHALEAPMRAAPGSIQAQLSFLLERWGQVLGDELGGLLRTAVDIIHEEHTFRGGGGAPPPPPVLTYARPDEEYERFSDDKDWMSNVVLLAKSTYVWLDQLSKKYGRTIQRIDQIPDEELDQIAQWGFTSLWLIGLWERSTASATIKQRMGNPEAVASAYSLKDYAISEDLGGHAAYESLSYRAKQRGIRLAADMVPNHFGLDSEWVLKHPDRFLSVDAPPYPGYQFPEPNLGRDGVGIHLEQGYWNHSDAAVVFCRVDHHTGERRYIYHGNDGTHMPWNDTAQIDYLNPEAREAVIQEILGVARRFHIIRFDAAMTLARRHIRRLWYPPPGDGGAIPSRAERGLSPADFDRLLPNEFWREVVDRVAAEVPDTLLLAEAFWLMEGYFVRTLGMHRVYNSAFMHMMKDEDNEKYRQTIKNTLEFSPEVLKRFVNFQNNPDEETAAVQFGTGDKYFGVATMMVTMPGLPMWGHGQVAGLREKYGMEYRRAYFDESDDPHLIARHEHEIFPLMRRRHLFSQAEHFALYDVQAQDGSVQSDVYAFSNRSGDERALVLFNNRYQGSSGTIRMAAPVNIARGGETRLQYRSLSDALALPTGWKDLVGFQEQRSGKWFLRSAQSLADTGVQLQLRGYECQVFLNFKIITNADDTWWQLHNQLGGSSCSNLYEAREDLALQPMVETLQEGLAECEALADALATLREHNAPELLPRHLARLLEVYVPPSEAPFAAALVHQESLEALIEACRGLLGVNEYEGVQWYRGESMDILLRVVELGQPEYSDALAEAHAASGYRYDELLALVNDGKTRDTAYKNLATEVEDTAPVKQTAQHVTGSKRRTSDAPDSEGLD